MPVSAAISAIGSIGSSFIGANAASKASSQQVNALNQAVQTQQGMFNTAQGALSPFYSAGASVLPTLQALLTPGANMTNVLSQLPGFEFAQNWGQKAVQNSGTTTGLGGNVLTAGANYATGLAQQGFGGLVNALQGFVNTGANAAGSLGSTASNFASTIGNTFSNIGNAQAAGTLGTANALSSGLNTLGNTALLSRLFNNTNNGIYQGNVDPAAA